MSAAKNVSILKKGRGFLPGLFLWSFMFQIANPMIGNPEFFIIYFALLFYRIQW